MHVLLLYLPTTSLYRLQRVLNSAARIVSRQQKHFHITPILFNLHWLPIEQRIKFKVLLFVFKCIHDIAPAYLCDLIHFKQNERNLRSSNTLLLDNDTPSNRYGERSFSIYGPTEWNKLPVFIRKTDCLESFKSKLKTFLFKEAFPQFTS